MAEDIKTEIEVNKVFKRMQEDTKNDNMEISKILKILFILSFLTFNPSIYIFFLVLWLGFVFMSDFIEPKTAKIFTIVLFIFGYFMFLISVSEK